MKGFVEKYEALYPVFAEGRANDYSTGGVPSAALIAADGTVAAVGHPNELKEDMIEEQLGKVAKDDRVSTKAFLISRALPPLPDKLSKIEKDLLKDKYGKALTTVEKTLDKLPDEDKEVGEKIRVWIEKKGTDGLESAARLLEKGKIFAAYRGYEEVEDLFKGHDISKRAKSEIAKIKKDKAMKLEVKAGEKWEKIQEELREARTPKDALKAIAPLCSRKYAETEAGKEAAELEKKLQAQMDAGK